MGVKHEAAKELLARRKARAGLAAFCSYVSNGAWVPAPFHLDLCERLEEVERGECERLVVEMPPRFGKTSIISQFFPAWYFGRNASNHFIMASYAAGLAHSNSRRVKQILSSPEYKRIFPEVAVGIPDQVAEWGTVQGGHMLAVGRGGGATGHGANCLIVDDIYANREEADSQTVRDSSWDWFNSVMRTRRHGNAPMVVLHTRWHEDDLIGRLKQEGGWDAVTYKAIDDNGEALWPEKFPMPWLEDQRMRVGPRDWSALYQQSPAPDGGGIFKREWFKYYAIEAGQFRDLQTGQLANPHGWRRWASMDVAVTEKTTSDWTVLAIWAQSPDGRVWLLDLIRQRLETPAVLDLIASARIRYAVPAVHIETNGVGLPVFQTAQARKLPVIGVDQHRDKVSRARAIEPHFARGDVMFPRDAPWLAEFESELLTFPHGKHDDMTDATSLGIALSETTGYTVQTQAATPLAYKGAAADFMEPWLRGNKNGTRKPVRRQTTW